MPDTTDPTTQPVTTSTVTTPPAKPAAAAPPADPDPDDGKDWKAEADKWKALARKHETRVQQIEQSMMTEQEKAIAAAKDEGRREAHTESMQRVVAAEIRAALAGIVPDPAAIVEDLNLGKYLDAKGDVDSSAIEKLKAKFSGFAQQPARGPGSADLGARPSTTATALNGDPLERALRQKLGIG